MYGSWDMVRDGRAGGRADGRREKVTYRGGCPTWKYKKEMAAYSKENIIARK